MRNAFPTYRHKFAYSRNCFNKSPSSLSGAASGTISQKGVDPIKKGQRRAGRIRREGNYRYLPNSGKVEQYSIELLTICLMVGQIRNNYWSSGRPCDSTSQYVDLLRRVAQDDHGKGIVMERQRAPPFHDDSRQILEFMTYRAPESWYSPPIADYPSHFHRSCGLKSGSVLPWISPRPPFDLRVEPFVRRYLDRAHSRDCLEEAAREGRLPRVAARTDNRDDLHAPSRLINATMIL